MTTLELDIKRANIIRMISSTEDEAILTEIEHFLSQDVFSVKERDECFYSPEALRQAVLESEEDIRQGRVHTIEEIRAIHPRL